MITELSALEGKAIQGLFATPDDRFYATLLARVQLGSFQTQQKVSPEGRLKQPKRSRLFLAYCRDCGTPHQTGSQIWFECPVAHRWRTSMEVCVYPTREKKEVKK